MLSTFKLNFVIAGARWLNKQQISS